MYQQQQRVSQREVKQGGPKLSPVPKKTYNYDTIHASEPAQIKQKKVNSALEKPFNTEGLSVRRHKLNQSASADSYIQITEEGWLILYLGKQAKKLSISPDGVRMIVHTTANRQS